MTHKVALFIFIFCLLYIIRQVFYLLGNLIFDQEHIFTIEDAMFSGLSISYILTTLLTM